MFYKYIVFILSCLLTCLPPQIALAGHTDNNSSSGKRKRSEIVKNETKPTPSKKSRTLTPNVAGLPIELWDMISQLLQSDQLLCKFGMICSDFRQLALSRFLSQAPHMKPMPAEAILSKLETNSELADVIEQMISSGLPISLGKEVSGEEFEHIFTETVLKHVRVLDLSKINLDFRLLEKLPSTLTGLNLGHVFNEPDETLTDRLADQGFPALKHLGNLEHLYLEGHPILNSDVELLLKTLPHPEKLKTLVLTLSDRNDEDGPSPSILRLLAALSPNLTRLELPNSEGLMLTQEDLIATQELITNGSLTQLKHLILVGVTFEERESQNRFIQLIQSFTNLEELNIADTLDLMPENISNLAKALTHLRTLNLNVGISSETLSAISQFSKLEQLNLVGYLERPDHLDSQQVHQYFQGMTQGAFTRLKSLTLEAEFTAQDLENVASSWSAVEDLTLSEMDLSGGKFAWISSLSHLKILDLKGNELSRQEKIEIEGVIKQIGHDVKVIWPQHLVDEGEGEARDYQMPLSLPGAEMLSHWDAFYHLYFK